MNNLKPRITDIDTNFKNYLFYDFEVFSHDIFVVFKNYSGKTVYYFHNQDFIENQNLLKEITQNHILVGYNNYGYDDYILQYLIDETDYCMKKKYKDEYMFISKAKRLNDRIISGERPGNQPYSIVALDCMQQIFVSLKKIEANIGLNIKETDIPFDIDRPLTEEEIALVKKYCEHDVNATIDVFKLRWKSYFEPKLQIIELLHGDKFKALRWNTTTITANILTQDKETVETPTLKLSNANSKEDIAKDNEAFFDKINDGSIEMKTLIDMWKSGDTKGKQIINRFNTEFTFGFGGLHGVNNYRKTFHNVKLLDVASMYPNILLNINGLSDIQTYKDIVEERIRIKHTNPVLSTALKLVVNSTYGLLKNKYSKLFNPKISTSVCIYGQIALYKLCEMLSDEGYTIVNANTDGVAFTGNTDNWKKVKEKWEKEFNLSLELDEFKTWTQKDVNNYLAVKRDGSIKLKGKDTKHYKDKTDFSSDLMDSYPGDSWNNTNSLQIVTKCLVEYLINGKDPIDTIEENLNKPIMFQMVLQPGKTFKGIVDEFGNSDYQKVNRVFAVKKSPNSVTLVKKREDGGLTSFQDAPENMFIWNESLEDLNLKDIDLDFQFYLDKVETVINRWK